MSDKLEPQQKMNSEFLKPCFLEKIRKNWSLKFGRTGVDRQKAGLEKITLTALEVQGLSCMRALLGAGPADFQSVSQFSSFELGSLD